ncbi:hypothetical protein H0H81_002456 [Sphagnurus paluster]|uniref:Polysaccharide lyase family 8 protein n=1 Tax=Sphagnurus paluster TaxID=117069 RepID=A0A9P7GN33_9AGAR|nr:hypothetical protein H0H81_002456 [Sphagnurus paluster]
MVILIPRLVGQSCVLLDDTLTPTQAVNCARITRRSYDVFVNRVGYLTGANTLDVASIGINLALLTTDTTILADAYTRIHSELVIRNEVKADGIRADGSFGIPIGSSDFIVLLLRLFRQGSTVAFFITEITVRFFLLENRDPSNNTHAMSLGKDYVNTILDIEREAGGTKYAANAVSQNAFATLFDGDRWMIYGNSLANVLHWDFSALGRFISFPVVDNQATGSIKINLTEVRELGQQWSSSSLLNFADTLSQSFTNANAGGLTGNRMFYNNDYMVCVQHIFHTSLTVQLPGTSRLKLCIDGKDVFVQDSEHRVREFAERFHLSDGTLYTYLRGDEYEDISAAWDWNLIPGTTIDYKATALSCDQALVTGVERFVGGVSDGKIGLAAMRYTNPSTKAFRWQKVWFFLNDDVQHVMIANISSTTTSPVYSVLDQRRLSGSPVTGEATVGTTKVQTLWHGNVGYILPPNNVTKLSVQTGSKTGDWATIGTSEQPPTTVNLFAAWVQHTSLATPISYTAFPGTDSTTFSTKVQQLRLQAVRNDARGSAVFDEVNNTAMIVFWDGSAGSITFTPPGLGAITISSNGNVAIIYKLNTGQVVAADPSQTLSTIQVTISIPTGKKPPVWSSSSSTKILTFSLPQGGTAGNGVTLTV